MKKAAVLPQSLINGTGRAAAFLYEKSANKIHHISSDPCNNTL